MPYDAEESQWLGYLLQTLPDGERETLGRRLLEDPRASEALADFENRLIDDCAREKLDTATDHALRRYLEETNQMHRLGFATALLRAEKRPRRYTGIAVAAVLCVIAAGTVTYLRMKADAPVVYIPAVSLRGAYVPSITMPKAGIVTLDLELPPPPPGGRCRAQMDKGEANSGPCSGAVFHYRVNAPVPGRHEVRLHRILGEQQGDMVFDYFFTVPAK